MTGDTDLQEPPALAIPGCDRDLAARVVAGELQLFELIMRRYNRRLFLIARSILGSDSDAEDVVQSAYITGWRHLAEFKGPDGLGSWFSRITINEALMRLRSRRARSEADFDEAAQHLSDGRPGPEEEVGSMQITQLLEQAIDQLPPAYRTTYVLREVEQLSVAETSASLGIEPATVKTRLHRARRLLRRHLQQRLTVSACEAFPFAGTRCDRMVERTMARIAAETADNDTNHQRTDS